MNIVVSIDNISMYPENDAEVHQLEYLRVQLEIFKKRYYDSRQWSITALRIPLEDVEE